MPAHDPITDPTDVVVVGAGAAGLTAAALLSSDLRVVVVDKARGVGGRMATRRIGDATFDHGAQFVTTHHPDFAATVQQWCDAGVARPWFRGQVGPTGVDRPDGHVRFRGSQSMNAVAKHLAAGTDVRRSTRVTALRVDGDRWRVALEDGGGMDAAAVVLAAPVPQALELLAAGSVELAGPDAAALSELRYHPCLAALVPLDGPSGVPAPGAVAPDQGPIGWIADNVAKGISSGEGVTIHATPAHSEARWGRPDDEVVDELVAAARRTARLVASPVPGLAQVQRWRFARPAVLHPAPYLLARGVPPLVLCGDAFGEAKVEGAVRSGVAAADALRSTLVRR